MIGTGQLLVMEAAAVILGACLGYVPGRILRRRERYEAEQDGYDACLDDYDDVLRAGGAAGRAEMGSGLATMPQPEIGLEYAGGDLASLAGGSLPGHDWREQVAAELAPEALAQQVPLPSVDEGLERDVPEPGHGAQGEPVTAPFVGHETAGLGHPSPYAGQLTPAQRRRDKHKQRGQYAPEAEPGDDTLTDLFAEFGTWDQQVAAIEEYGQSPWFSDLMDPTGRIRMREKVPA